jgi:capsular exopolysaccharide synthesis family protein
LEELKNNTSENIDFGKLKTIVRSNILWVVLIFVIANAISILYVRYTKDVYESVSEIKLDVKQNASELGIREIVPDKNLDLISGEIETIQSKLFLNTVIDSLDLHISYFSVGNFLNEELYKGAPFAVKFIKLSPALHNVSFSVEQKNSSEVELRMGEDGSVIHGSFNQPLTVGDSELIIYKKLGAEFQTEIHYSFIYNSREVLLDYLVTNLTVEPINFNAKTIKVSFVDKNPIKARDLVNGIDSLYLQYSNEQKNLANKQKIDWLNNELSQIEEEMGGYEDYFENFTLKNKTSDLKEDLKKTISQINRIDSQRFELSKRITEINQLLDNVALGDFYLNNLQRKSLPDAINKNLEKLQPLVVEMDRMRLSYNESTFAFRQKEKEIQTLKDGLFKELTSLKAEWLQRLQELNTSKSRLEQAFANMPDKNTQFNKKQRFYKLNEEIYVTLMQHKSEFEIAQAGSTPDFKLLSTATLPTTPIAPKKMMIYGIGFVAGIILNIFLIGILYLANDKITNPGEVERLTGVPLLGIVPKLRRQNGSGIHIMDHPKSMVSEAMRTLRTNLDFFSVNATKKIIAISSTVSGEGKSFIALNLGGIMALSKKKVVLLDLDMRKHKINTISEPVDASRGVSTILIRKHSWQECIVKTSIENLDFIPSGPQPPNPSELLLNGEFTNMLEGLKTQYDFILLDTPPVGLVTDGIMAMKRADISIYVFRANYSKKEFLQSLQRVLKLNKFTNVTSVLNALPPVHEGYYGSGYYEEEPSTTSKLKTFFKRA